ncbi:MAG TPA: PDZ domain-containing protein [Tepidisphaeraceae bacterium]|jgi:hypothetical protein|nr:PDZ domain-containing protein [Tepidisphaeraceae bacterium]
MTHQKRICLGAIALLIVGRFALADDPNTSAATVSSIDGKTIIVQSGGGSSSSGSGGGFSRFQPDRSIRINIQPDAGKMVKAAFLGVTVSPVTAALRSQLKLPPGVGLVVESVEDGSPAGKAGIERYDILQNFNDQILIDPQQFGVLVRLAKPGTEVTLKAIHNGDSITVKAKLDEREMAEIDSFGRGPELFGDMNGLNAKLDRSQGSLKEALEVLRNAKNAAGQVSYSDKGMTLQITQQDGKRQLLAKDAAGKLLFDGPINTDDEKGKLPREVARRLAQMEPATRPKSDE